MTDGQQTGQLENIATSSGLAFSPDGTKRYVAHDPESIAVFASSARSPKWL